MLAHSIGDALTHKSLKEKHRERFFVLMLPWPGTGALLNQAGRMAFGPHTQAQLLVEIGPGTAGNIPRPVTRVALRLDVLVCSRL
jgi:hypothetical protein